MKSKNKNFLTDWLIKLDININKMKSSISWHLAYDGPAVIKTYNWKQNERDKRDGPASKIDPLVYSRKGKKAGAEMESGKQLTLTR